ncbi:MAG: extracellular solute-binding protein family 1 [Paenibacillaceae bacterium]|jgi:putative aldouronate transport system substrate-binding protein|nr:extracellular solute-binding protein family 1 [Paenibacillaceae bacterium]
MNMKVKGLLSASVVLALGVSTACSSGGGSGGSSASSSPAGSAAPQGSEAPVLEKKSISIVLNNVGRKFPEGLNENNNPYLDYIRKGANLDIKVTYPPADGYVDSLNVIMASGNLPDSISTWSADWVENYVRQKALQPLDDVLQKYGQNLLKNIPEEAWKSVTFNGKIYAIPGMNSVFGDEIVYIRKDWLDNLGLQPPQTLDEYKAVMKAFATQDPDQNGKNDTFGFSMLENLGRTAPIFGAFGVQKGIWMEQDGKLVSSVTLPETKAAVAFLADLHKENLIDPEWPLNKPATLNEKVASGKVGFFVGQWHETRSSIANSKKNDPKANWIALGFPTGKDGKKGTVGYHLVSSYNVVPVTSKNPDAVVRMIDFIMGEGYKTMLLGFENEVWKNENGKIVTNNEEHTKHIYRQTLSEYFRPYKNAADRDRLDSLGAEYNLNATVDMINANAMPSKFSGTPTPSMGKNNSTLAKLEEEYFVKIVVGQLPVDAYDDYVSEWKKKGGDEITKEVNEWYANNK